MLRDFLQSKIEECDELLKSSAIQEELMVSLVRKRTYEDVLKQLSDKTGVNPITLTGHDQETGAKVFVTISRLHLRVPKRSGAVEAGRQRINPQESDAINMKRLDVLCWNGEPSSPKILAKCVLDEDHFVRGLKHLLPDLIDE